MNEAILNYLTHLYGHVAMILVTTAALLIAMGIDLIFGVRKAAQRGEARTSTGLKKTCEKAWQKEELRKAEKTMNVIIENKDDLAKMVAAIIFQQEQSRNGTTGTDAGHGTGAAGES